MGMALGSLTAALAALPTGSSEAEFVDAVAAVRQRVPAEVVGAFDAAAGRLLAEVRLRSRLADRHRELLLRLTELDQELDSSRERQAVLGERSRIAQDLHDRAAQTNFLVVLKLDWVLARMPAESPLRPELERLKELAGEAAAQTREAIYALRAPEMVHGGVVGGIRSVVRSLKADGIEGSLSVAGMPVPLPQPVEEALFKLAQEAVNNARKHSRGSAVMVTLRYAPSAVTLVVQDNGVGLPPGAEHGVPGHFGLTGMQERVGALGGNLALLAGDEGGLIVRATLPIGKE